MLKQVMPEEAINVFLTISHILSAKLKKKKLFLRLNSRRPQN